MLEAAHRGYAYQDSLVATRVSDVLLGEIVTAIVDKKLVSDSRFDDLMTIERLNGPGLIYSGYLAWPLLSVGDGTAERQHHRRHRRVA